jgi:hypothetical protein
MISGAGTFAIDEGSVGNDCGVGSGLSGGSGGDIGIGGDVDGEEDGAGRAAGFAISGTVGC